MKKYAISPVDVFTENNQRFITKGKPYIIATRNYGFEILDDDGDVVYCKYEHCYVLNINDKDAECNTHKWTIIESECDDINV